MPLSVETLISNRRIIIAFVILMVALAVVVIPKSGDIGDEGLLLAGAERMLSGERLYQDFWSWIPPGSYTLLMWAWGIFGKSYAVVRVLAFMILAVNSILLYLYARECSCSKTQAFIASAFYAMVLVPYHSNYSYHWLTLGFVLVALFSFLRFLKRDSIIWLACTALALGIGTLFLHIRTPILLLVFFSTLFWKARRNNWNFAMFWKRMAVLALGFSIPVAIFLVRYRSDFLEIWHGLVVDNIVYYPNVNYIALATSGVFWIFLTSSIILVVVGWRVWYGQISMITPLVASIALLASIFYRFDITHVSYVIAPATPLIFLIMARLWDRTALKMFALLVAVLPLVLLILFSPLPFYLRRTQWQSIETSIGTVSFPKQAAVVRAAVLEQLKQIPADEVFIYPFAPYYYPFSGKRNPTRFSIILERFHSPQEFDELKNDLRHSGINNALFVPHETIFSFDQEFHAWITTEFPVATVFFPSPNSSLGAFTVFRNR